MTKLAIVQDGNGNEVNRIILDDDANPADWNAVWASDDPTAEEVRELRDRMLASTDWWGASDLTMTEEQKAFRQALRDVTEQSGFPHDVVWPEPPSA